MDAELVMTVAEIAADREKNNRQRWNAARRQGIGGSDAAAVLGLSPWRKPYALWQEKRGEVEPEDISQKEPVLWGTKLEPIIAEEWAARTGKKVISRGLFRDKKYPYMLANIDRQVVGEDAILEIKTTNRFNVEAWGKEAEDTEDGNVPPYYYCQCMHYLAVTGAARCYLACLIGGQHLVLRHIDRDEDEIAAIRKAEGDFWELVKNGKEPELDGSDSTAEAIRRKYGEGEPGTSIPLDSEAQQALVRLAQLKEKIREIEEEKRKIETGVQAQLGANETGVCTNGIVCTWKAPKPSVTLDTKAMKKERPKLYEAIFAQYGKERKSTRRFTVKYPSADEE